MSDDQFFYSSGFAQWSAQHEPIDYQTMLMLGDEALALLVKSVSNGEITTIDGVDSPLSIAIKAHHRLTDFEMNAHWIGSSQAWSCPCCGRSKFHVSRIGKKNQILAKLVIHHDHMGEPLLCQPLRRLHRLFFCRGFEFQCAQSGIEDRC